MHRPASLPLPEVIAVDPPSPKKPINPITTGAYWGPEKVAEKRALASYSKPPPSLKLAVISNTPPHSPPSPFNKSFPDMPTIDRMDIPPPSPPETMPKLTAINRLKRVRQKDDEEDKENQPTNKRLRDDALEEQYNKSKNWSLPDEDGDF